MRYLRTVVLVLAVTAPAFAQNEAAGWTFYQRFQGSSSGSGLILKSDSSLGYTFNHFFHAYAGLPIYFVEGHSTGLTPAGSQTVEAARLMTGIGNAYAGFIVDLDNPVVRYSSNVVVTAPTGDKERGFSTGRSTVDWTNTFSRSFSRVTPYASAGLANTISDTSFFVRPFSSLGLVGHFEAGTLIAIAPVASVGGSGYAVKASGEQRIVSRVVSLPSADQPSSRGRGRGSSPKRVFESDVETVGAAEIADDHGFSAWVSVNPARRIDFQIGYNRSVRYELDSLFMGIGFRIGK